MATSTRMDDASVSSYKSMRSPYTRPRRPRKETLMVRYDFAKKNVLVTGSSRGMGAAILEQFAIAGATCVVNFFDDPAGQNRRDAEQTAERLHGHNVPVHVLGADVS